MSLSLEFLDFKIEEQYTRVPNPYFIKSDSLEIVWQCEGHINEKKIFVPKSWFPYILKEGIYPFTFYIQGRKINTFRTVYKGEECIVIELKDWVRKHECTGRTNTLCFAIGKEKRIVQLPQPTLLVRDGELVS